MPSVHLAGLRVLIVEDHYLIATELARFVRAHGGDVVGPTASRQAALALLDEQPVDIAMLDINLAGQPVYPLADALEKLQIPFMFVTGYERGVVPTSYAHAPYVDKPISADKVIAAVRQLLSGPPGPSSAWH